MKNLTNAMKTGATLKHSATLSFTAVSNNFERAIAVAVANSALIRARCLLP